MKLVCGLVLLALGIAAEAVAGDGVWTLAPASSPSDMLVVGPGGALYADCLGNICKSLNHGLSWQTLDGPSLCNGLSFCSTSLLAVNPSGAIYVAFYEGGGGLVSSTLSVSRDDGTSWTTLLSQLFGNSLSLSADPSSAGTLVLLGGLLLSNGIPYNGFLGRSVDSGADWTWTDDSAFGGSSVTAFAFDPRTIGRFYAAAAEVALCCGVLGPPTLDVSNDGGSKWIQSAANTSGPFVTMVVDPFHASTIIGGGPSGVFRSSDGGQTFSSQSGAAVLQVVADPVRSGRFYAAAPPNGVLTSSDGGATWTHLNAGLTDLGVSASPLMRQTDICTRRRIRESSSTGYPTQGRSSSTPRTRSRSRSRRPTRIRARRLPVWRPRSTTSGATSAFPAITNNPNNPEVFVKLLDGTAINGEYWFFYGGLTNLEYTLTVTDSTTGKQKTYTKPAGSECGGSDTAAFAP